MNWSDVSSAPCFLNGEFLPLSEAKVSVLDRGFIFGDGIYEVVPVYYRQPFRLQQHMARFERSLGEIKLLNPMSADQWHSMLQQLIAGCNAEHQFVYWQVTRGVAKRDFSFPAAATPTVFAMTTPFTRPSAAVREQGLRVVTRADERWLRCDIKSVSLLGAVLARQYATEHHCDEVLQFRDGYLTEGSASNAWIVKGGRLIGVPRNHLILEGIRYGFMAELAQTAGVPFEARTLTRDDVLAADEIMLTAATREVLPVVQVDGQAIGAQRAANATDRGQPGPVYLKLRAAYDTMIESLRQPSASTQ